MTTMCLSCGRQHDSWRSYCTNCMQTHAITKHMEKLNSVADRNLSSVSSVVNPGTYSESTNPFSWLLTSKIGTIGLYIWMFYMLWNLISGGQFTAWDWIIGLVFFIWMGSEY